MGRRRREERQEKREDFASKRTSKKRKNALLAIAILFIPGTARVIRSESLSVSNRDYVTASRALGATGALQNLEKNFRALIDQFKGDLDKMDRMMQKKEDELGISI